MMYLLGIDGGGTKTRVVLINERGDLLGLGLSGASSIKTVNNETTKKSLLQAYEEAVKGLKIDKLDAVFAGLGDVESNKDKELVSSMIKEFDLVTEDTQVKVENDAYNALYGGLGNLDEGVSIILGTGSVAIGINKEGKTAKVGGYSHKEGDPGSSYALGKKCLSFAAMVLDGRRDKSNFSRALLKELKVTDRISYINMIDAYYEDRTKTASLAKLVTKYSVLGDLDAFDICYEGITGALELIDTTTRKLKIKHKNVAIIGSLGNSEFYFSGIKKSLSTVDVNYNVFPNILDPSIGAAIGAMKLLGLPLSDQVIKELKENDIS